MSRRTRGLRSIILALALVLPACSGLGTTPAQQTTDVPVIFDDESAITPFLSPDPGVAGLASATPTPRPTPSPTPRVSATPTASPSAGAIQQDLPASGSNRDSILRVQATTVDKKGFSFAFMGDSRNASPISDGGEANYARTIAAVNKSGAQFVMHGGDFTFDNFQVHWRAVQKLHQQLNLPLITVVGNHDVLFGRSFYEGTFTPPNPASGLDDYSFDYGGVRFIALDDANFTITANQFAWLADQLNTGLIKVVAAHAPPNVGNWASHGLKDLKISQRLLQMLDAAHVDLVLLSHIHLFDDSVRRGNTQYILSGGAGAPLSPSKFGNALYHFVLIHVDAAGKLTYRMVPVN